MSLVSTVRKYYCDWCCNGYIFLLYYFIVDISVLVNDAVFS